MHARLSRACIRSHSCSSTSPLTARFGAGTTYLLTRRLAALAWTACALTSSEEEGCWSCSEEERSSEFVDALQKRRRPDFYTPWRASLCQRARTHRVNREDHNPFSCAASTHRSRRIVRTRFRHMQTCVYRCNDMLVQYLHRHGGE